MIRVIFDFVGFVVSKYFGAPTWLALIIGFVCAFGGGIKPRR